MNAADVLLYMCSGSDKPASSGLLVNLGKIKEQAEDKPASSGLLADTPLQKLQEETL